MSNIAKKSNKNYQSLIYVLLVIVMLFSSCTAGQATETNNETITITPTAQSTPDPTPTYSPTPTPDPRLQAEYSSPRIIGSSRAILRGSIQGDLLLDEAGFLLSTLDGETVIDAAGVLYEDEYYLQVDDLVDGSEYQIEMYYIVDGKKEYAQNEMTFATPKKIYTNEEVTSMLRKAMSGEEYAEDSRKYAITNTQRALKLLGINCGDLGIKCYSLQLNQIKLEYSLNSYDRYTNWDAVDGECDADTVKILKDIISVEKTLEHEDFFCTFTPSPHALSDYNKHDDEGGQFDAEQYLYDNLANDEVAYASYVEYPFIYESPEFQEKYSNLIEENEGNEELSTDIMHRVAENKFFFSYYNKAYMDVYAIPQDRYIDLYYAGGMTIQTAAAFSYLVTEIPSGYGPLKISTSYRDYTLQAYFYTRGNVMGSALEYGDYWHLYRQRSSYVPGFSNHQYGIAIDFQDIASFADNPLYGYLQKNAQRYGFYNYYPEAWHWVYLGE